MPVAAAKTAIKREIHEIRVAPWPVARAEEDCPAMVLIEMLSGVGDAEPQVRDKSLPTILEGAAAA
jgi:hypothetical protein